MSDAALPFEGGDPASSLIRRALLADRWPWIAMALIVGETVAVGAEVGVLASAGQDSTVSAISWLIGLFFFLSLLRILLSASISVVREMWHVSFTNRLLLTSAERTRNRPDLYTDFELSASRVSAALSNGYMVTANVVQFCCGVTRCGMQYVAIALVFCITLGVPLLLPFCFGLALTVLLARRFQGISGKYAERTENARIQLGNTFSAVWDCVVLGNKSWSERWFDAYAKAFAPYRSATLKQCAMDFSLQMSQAVVTYAAFAITAAVMLSRGNGTNAILIGFLASLPKFVQLLSLQSQFSQYVTATGFLRGQCVILEKSIGEPARRDLVSRIANDDVRVNPGQASPHSVIDMLADDNRRESSGRRLTVRGPNGSGKTSMLLNLKVRLGESALMIPANVARVVGLSETIASTGEHHLHLLRDALLIAREPVLLFDEWDAHLDDKRIAEVEALIGHAVSTGRFIVETRHRAAI